jgi:hypothetical protein
MKNSEFSDNKEIVSQIFPSEGQKDIGSRISDPEQRSIFSKRIVTRSRKYDPGFLSWIPGSDPGSNFFQPRIPDPGVKKHRLPDPQRRNVQYLVSFLWSGSGGMKIGSDPPTTTLNQPAPSLPPSHSFHVSTVLVQLYLGGTGTWPDPPGPSGWVRPRQ